MNHAYLHWDVFTGEPLLGNQLAVFTHSGFLEPERSRVVFGLNVGPTPVDLEWGTASSCGSPG